MLKWGLLNLTEFATVQTNSYSPLQLYMLKGPQAFQLLLRNANFLQNLPPITRSFEDIPTNSTSWEEDTIKQGEEIRSELLKNYPLAFGPSDGNVSEYAAVRPVKVFVNEGARPINRSTCPKIPPGMELSCKAMIENLEQQGVIQKHNQLSKWCAPARFILKSIGQPRLVINFQGLNSPM